MKSKATWNVEDLKTRLTDHEDIISWCLRSERSRRRERYFIKGEKPGTVEIDQDRSVHQEDFFVTLMVKSVEANHQGETERKFFKDRPMEEQISAAVDLAKQTKYQSWRLAAPVSDLPEVETVDPEIHEDLDGVMNRLTKEVYQQVETRSKKVESFFNSAEIFLTLVDTEITTSTGASYQFLRSCIYGETAFSAEENNVSDEYLTTRWSVSLKDFSLDELFEEASTNAVHSLDVKFTEGGKYPVILGADVLATLFHDISRQMSGSHIYHRLPSKKPGEELFKEPIKDGDLLNIKADPLLSFGAASGAVSDFGQPQEAVQLVKDGKVVGTLMSQRYGAYLKEVPNLAEGNILVQPGENAFKALSQKFPKVLEILQFSGLFSDANSATFSSEIRLARLYDNEKGTVTYLKGGSVSGSFFENFRTVYLSKEMKKVADFPYSNHRVGYYGPAHALITEVSVAGR